VVVSKIFGLADPRTYGSKNPGATNVLRSGNKKAAALTLLGDGFKGWLAVWLAQKFGPQGCGGYTGIALVTLAVFLGHLWPVFFRFVGGKGVATPGHPAGAGCGWAWRDAGDLAVVAFAFRYSSLAALVAALFAPFYYGLLFGTTDGILLAGHGRAADLSPPQEHRQPAGRQGKPHRRQEEGGQVRSERRTGSKENEKMAALRPLFISL
jgi:glycerol-3-phosphate acyltransferase PlsY